MVELWLALGYIGVPVVAFAGLWVGVVRRHRRRPQLRQPDYAHIRALENELLPDYETLLANCEADEKREKAAQVRVDQLLTAMVAAGAISPNEARREMLQDE